ncbi:hypothetical protein LPAF129_16270 [Ligilactobacillus pabuli]|uniref:Uncharacterized protein n=1 Tax=Ligilactobacillus pabuli TaxID=2886039 RepID=A0ABQ5JNA4_9LACO|nr:hypothetical protein LPAF129_16270 [Ligilactobacillus pabuli]
MMTQLSFSQMHLKQTKDNTSLQKMTKLKQKTKIITENANFSESPSELVDGGRPMMVTDNLSPPKCQTE